MIERAILDAEMKGVKVLSLGLLNQASKFKYLFAYIKCIRYLLLKLICACMHLCPHRNLMDPNVNFAG